uniref:myelin-oligodendrocyte glycoprotein-like isoform X2 n=1 Tax=Scatophagus argus TaxID=75038 RepID=UPI001ED7CECA|nr:myelin-oligodendrocyte glycoprotein-like isoform X2 [Scatophagus argus]
MGGRNCSTSTTELKETWTVQIKCLKTSVVIWRLSNRLTFSVSSGELRLMCPTQRVRAKEGESVTLPCRLDQRIDLSKDTVDWTKLYPEETVHVYRGGQDDPDPQSPQYRDRTTLNREDLKTGNLALHISSVKQSDSGTYRCYIPKREKCYTVDLLIETPSQLVETNTSPPAEGGPYHWAAVIAVVLFVLLVLKKTKIWDCVKRVCRR